MAAGQHARGLVTFAAGLGLTAGSLAALHTARSHPSRPTEVAVVVAANLAATLLAPRPLDEETSYPGDWV